MTTVSNNALFTTCLSSTFKLVKQQPELRMHFENSYKEHLCDFNFEQYLLNGCVISLSKKVEALKQACMSTRDHAGMLLERAPDDKSRDTILPIYYQIWTQSFSATLAQITKSTVKLATPVAKIAKSNAETKMLPNLPPEWTGDVQNALWALADSGSHVIYPKLCSLKACAACAELLFDLPLSKCSIDCQHPKLAHDVFPHLSRKFSDRLKPHHGQESVKVKETYKPHTFHNPMWRSELPSCYADSVKDLEKGVESMELASTSASSSVTAEMTASPRASDTSPQTTNESWSDMVEEEMSAHIANFPTLPAPALKREHTVTELSRQDCKRGKPSTRKGVATRSTTKKMVGQ